MLDSPNIKRGQYRVIQLALNLCSIPCIGYKYRALGEVVAVIGIVYFTSTLRNKFTREANLE
jgi:hypothetical protein